MNRRPLTFRALWLGLVGAVAVVAALHGSSLVRDRAASHGAGVGAMSPPTAPDRAARRRDPPRFVATPGDPAVDPPGAASPPRPGDFEGNDE